MLKNQNAYCAKTLTIADKLHPIKSTVGEIEGIAF